MKKLSYKLSLDEAYVLSLVLNSAVDCLDWDEDLQQYTDGGRFLICLDKAEYETLRNIRL